MNPQSMRHEVLLPVELARTHQLGVQLRSVRDQRGVPRLHHAEVDPVLAPVAARVHHVVARRPRRPPCSRRRRSRTARTSACRRSPSRTRPRGTSSPPWGSSRRCRTRTSRRPGGRPARPRSGGSTPAPCAPRGRRVGLLAGGEDRRLLRSSPLAGVAEEVAPSDVQARTIFLDARSPLGLPRARQCRIIRAEDGRSKAHPTPWRDPTADVARRSRRSRSPCSSRLHAPRLPPPTARSRR